MRLNTCYSTVLSVFLWSQLSSNIAYAMTVATNPPHILSVGLAAVDFVAVVDHFPEPDEKMRSSELFIQGGGNAANTACTIGKLSPMAKCSIVTGVGDDANGATILSGLNKYNVNTDYCKQFPGPSPFSYILTTDQDGDNTRTCIHQPAKGDLTVEFVDETLKDKLSDFTAVHFDVRYPKAAMEIAKLCVEQNIPYSVDVERPREGLLEIMEHATIVVCNSIYCDTILKEDEKNLGNDNMNVVEKLKYVINKQAPNAKIAIQTLGSKGSCLIQLDGKDGNLIDIPDDIILENKDKPNYPVVTGKDNAMFCTVFGGVTNIVDTTGAGDSFQGGFLTAYWNTLSAANNKGDNDDKKEKDDNNISLARCLRFASRVASEKIQKPGARLGLPDSNDEFLKEEMDAILLKSQKKKVVVA